MKAEEVLSKMSDNLFTVLDSTIGKWLKDIKNKYSSSALLLACVEQ